MSKSIIFNCTVKVETVRFHISLDKYFFETATRPVLLHNHAAYEIHIIKSGSYAYNVDDRNIILEKNNCILIGPNVYHSKGNALSKDSCKYSFKFECSYKRGVFSEIIECVNKINNVCIIENCIKEISLVEALIDEFQARPIAYITFINNLFSQLILTIIRDASGFGKSMDNTQIKTTEENRSIAIDEFFAVNYMNNVHAVDLAKLLGLSIRQLNRVMLKLYGITFKQKLSQIRVLVAKDILADSSMTVMRVSEIVGYNNFGYFNATFKRFTGMTPEQYRKAQF